MYKIRGGDGKEYGPVSTETLRGWVNQGRANGQTFVLADGATEWKTLATCPEFADLFAAPPPGRTSATGGVPVRPATTSGMAVTSLVMGCVSFVSCGLTVVITSPLGLIFGLIAMNKIKGSQGQLKGRGLAIAGAIVSGVGLLLLIPVMAAMLLPALAKAKSKAQSINCVNNVKQLALGVRLYSADNNDFYPSGTNWCDAINQAVMPKAYLCPADKAQLRSGYAYNAKLSGLAEKDVAPGTVMIFESDAGWNASGGKELMITQPRHDRRYVVGLADGSVQQLTEMQIQQLRWDPKLETNNNP